MILTIQYTLKFDSFFISKSLLNVEEPQSNDYGFRGFYTKSGVLFSNKQFLPNYMMLQERRLLWLCNVERVYQSRMSSVTCRATS